MKDVGEDTKQSSKKKILIILVFITIILAIVGGTILFLNNRLQEEPLNNNNIIFPQINKFWNDESVTYYVGEVPESVLDNTLEFRNDYLLINTYSEYLEMLNKIDFWETKVKEYHVNGYEHEEISIENFDLVKGVLNKDKYLEEYFEESSLLVAEVAVFGGVLQDIDLVDVCLDDSELNVNIEYETFGVTGDETVTMFCVSLPKEKIENIENINIYSKYASNSIIPPGNMVAYKPIIYLYPTKEMDVSVKLGNPDKITCSYPKYDTVWNVLAKSNGDLKEIDTNRNLYALYYECENVYDFKIENDGFVIKGEESANFLEEKLKVLGLTEREAQEFIIYWLPKLEANKYNYIRFENMEEINENMPLEINPAPDTLIRVLMTYKGMEKPISIDEQQLVSSARDGYVAIEWGGTEIK